MMAKVPISETGTSIIARIIASQSCTIHLRLLRSAGGAGGAEMLDAGAVGSDSRRRRSVRHERDRRGGFAAGPRSATLHHNRTGGATGATGSSTARTVAHTSVSGVG